MIVSYCQIRIYEVLLVLLDFNGIWYTSLIAYKAFCAHSFHFILNLNGAIRELSPEVFYFSFALFMYVP